jgi:hypothetical protein
MPVDYRNEETFVNPKECLTTVPIFTYFKPKCQCIVDTDASDFTLGPNPNHKEDDAKPHPIAYCSRKFLPADINHETHNKELLAIVHSFKIW